MNAPLTTDVGTYLLQVVLVDIYGKLSSIDVTLVVVDALTSPIGVTNCYFVMSMCAFDVLYKTGTLKQNKLHFQVPTNSLNANCQQLLTMEANLNDASGNLHLLPFFMSLDSTNRQI